MNGRHAPATGLCERDHLCPPCINGTGDCADLYWDPTCGLVACMTGDPEETL